MMRINGKIIAGLSALFMLAGCSDRKETPAVLRKVKTVEAGRVSTGETLSFPAKVVSDDRINVSFKLPGRILSTAVQEGSAVSKGQLVATLDPRDYQIALDAAQAEYNSVKAEADRVIALYGDSATSAVNYDKAVYGLRQITAKLDHARDQLADTRIYAPVSGSVKTVYRRGGEVVGAGMPVVEIVDDGHPVVEIKIPASDYMRRDEFGMFTCRFDVYPGREFKLHPISYSSVANTNQLYTVKLGFDARQGALPSVGMTTSVEISVGSSDGPSAGTWTLPASALSGSGEDAHIFIVGTDSVLSRVPVTVERLTSGGDAVVRAAENIGGADIVAAGAGALREGQKVVKLASGSASNVGGLL